MFVFGSSCITRRFWVIFSWTLAIIRTKRRCPWSNPRQRWLWLPQVFWGRCRCRWSFTVERAIWTGPLDRWGPDVCVRFVFRFKSAAFPYCRELPPCSRDRVVCWLLWFRKGISSVRASLFLGAGTRFILRARLLSSGKFCFKFTSFKFIVNYFISWFTLLPNKVRKRFKKKERMKSW